MRALDDYYNKYAGLDVYESKTHELSQIDPSETITIAGMSLVREVIYQEDNNIVVILRLQEPALESPPPA